MRGRSAAAVPRRAILDPVSGTSVLDRRVHVMSDVDLYLGLPSGTARRWIEGYSRGGRTYPPVIRERLFRGRVWLRFSSRSHAFGEGVMSPSSEAESEACCRPAGG